MGIKSILVAKTFAMLHRCSAVDLLKAFDNHSGLDCRIYTSNAVIKHEQVDVMVCSL